MCATADHQRAASTRSRRLGPVSSDSPTGEDYRPRWAPDGSKIVFQRFEAGSAQSYIFVMNADGTNLQRLSTRRGFQPAWSPDGARIVFGSGSRHRAEIFVMNADGSNLTRLTNNTFESVYRSTARQSDILACSGATRPCSLLTRLRSYSYGWVWLHLYRMGVEQ